MIALSRFDTHAVLVEDVPAVAELGWHFDGVTQLIVLKQLVIAFRIFLPRRGPLFEMTKFHSQDGCLQRIQSAIQSDLGVPIVARVSMDSQTPQPRRQVGIVGGDESAVSRTAKVLGREKAEAPQSAQHASASAPVFRSDGLARVFYD